MFRESDFDILEFTPPFRGMNQNVSPDLLTPEYAYYLENVIPSPLGSLQVRYGTKEIFEAVVGNNFGTDIIGSFPYQTIDNKQQAVLYVLYFKQKEQAFDTKCISSDIVRFNAGDNETFEKGTKIAFEYRSTEGIRTTFSEIFEITQDEYGGTQVEIEDDIFPSDLVDFFIEQSTTDITRINNNRISFAVEDNFPWQLWYSDGQAIQISVDVDPPVPLTIAPNGIDGTVPNVITLTFNENTVPNFDYQINTVKLFYASETPEIRKVYIQKGMLVVYDHESDSLVDGVEVLNLSAGCVPRSVPFQKKVAICNGVNRNYTWDGTILEQIHDFVKEQADSFNRIDPTHFSFVIRGLFDVGKYQNNNLIQLNIDGNITNLTVEAINVVDQTVTIETQENIPAFTGQNVVELFYRDFPPPFSFMCVAHDRIFALGTGAVGLDYRSSDQALRAYYCYRENSLTNWFNENTKLVPSIDFSDKHGAVDNLEAIAPIGGYLAFIGRKKTQLWQGTDPTTSEGFFWYTNLPIGIPHGDLLIELANDVFFVSQNGIVSLNISRQISQQPAISSINAIDPMVREHLISIADNLSAYRACRSFKYVDGAFCGFKIGNNNTLVSMFDTSLYAWSIFSGDFKKTQTFMIGTDNRLYLFIDNFILEYGDTGKKVFTDNGGNDSIYWAWIPKQIDGKTRWANKYYQLDIDYPSEFTHNPQNQILIGILGDLSKTFSLEDSYELAPRGDLLNTVPLGEWRLEAPYSFPYNRLKFVSKKFSFIMEGYTENGLLLIRKIRILGLIERSRGGK